MLDQISRTDGADQPDTTVQEQHTQQPLIADLFAEIDRLSSKRRSLDDRNPAAVEWRRTEVALFESLFVQMPRTESDLITQFRAYFKFHKSAGSDDPYLHTLEGRVRDFYAHSLDETLGRVVSPHDTEIAELLSARGHLSQAQLCELVRLERTYSDWTHNGLFPDDEICADKCDVLVGKSMDLLWEIRDAIDETPATDAAGAAAKLRHLLFLKETDCCNPEDIVAGVNEVADFLSQQATREPRSESRQRVLKRAA